MSTDWIIPVALGTLPLVGAVVVWWAWFGERRSERATPRCPKCWHNMAGLPKASAMTCPECGRTARHAKHLHPKRRRRGVAAGGLLLLVLGPWLWTAYQKRGAGLVAFVPATPLILVMGWAPDYDHPVQRVLRKQAGSLEAWQIALIYRLHVDIDPADLEDVVTVADVWFRGEPVPVHTGWTNLRNVGAFAHSFEIRREDGTKIGSDGIPYTPWTPPGTHIHLRPPHERGTLPATDEAEKTYRLEASVRIYWNDPSFGSSRKTFTRTLTHTFERTVRLIDRDAPDAAEQLFEAVRDPAIDRFVADTFELSFGRNAYGDPMLFVRHIYDDDHAFDVSFAYDAEVYEGETLLFRDTHADDLIFDSPAPWHLGDDEELLPRVKRAGSTLLDPSGLTLRVRPRLDLAMHAPEMHRVWAGTVEGPLRGFLRCSHPGYSIAPHGE